MCSRRVAQLRRSSVLPQPVHCSLYTQLQAWRDIGITSITQHVIMMLLYRLGFCTYQRRDITRRCLPVTVIPDSMVIVHFQALQVLHKAPLQIPTARCLDSGIHQAVSPCHAMEVVLLGSETCQKPISDEPAGSGTCNGITSGQTSKWLQYT